MPRFQQAGDGGYFAITGARRIDSRREIAAAYGKLGLAGVVKAMEEAKQHRGRTSQNLHDPAWRDKDDKGISPWK